MVFMIFGGVGNPTMICHWFQVFIGTIIKKKYEDNILTKTINKKKNSELIRVFNEKNEETESFSIHWTKWTGWN